MFLIKWQPYNSLRIITGISRYDTREAAEKQIAIFSQLFRRNAYFVEPA